MSIRDIFVKYQNEVKQLKEENSSLKAEIVELKKELASKTVCFTQPTEEPAVSANEIKQNKRRKRVEENVVEEIVEKDGSDF